MTTEELLGQLYPNQFAPVEWLTIRQRGNILIWLPQIAIHLGTAYAWSGRVADAIPLLEQATAQGAFTRGMGVYQLVYLREAYLLAGGRREAPRGVCSLAAVKHILAPLGWHINTAFVERINLTIRQHVAAVWRRVSTLGKGEDGLRQQLAIFHCDDNFCLPHASVRLPLPPPEPTDGSGSATQWQPRTPAMAAGLTDQVWTLREVLLFRVPPWPQPAGM